MPKELRNIYVLGGGGFGMNPNSTLERAILSNFEKRRKPRITFIGTASGDDESYIERFYTFFKQFDARLEHIDLFRKNFIELESVIRESDFIYVGGGSTFNLLTLWKAWSLDTLIMKYYFRAELTLIGMSAGAMIWYEGGFSDSIGPDYTYLKCYSLLKGVFCPHCQGNRLEKFQCFLKENSSAYGIGLPDDCMIHYVNESFVRFYSEREGVLPLELNNG